MCIESDLVAENYFLDYILGTVFTDAYKRLIFLLHFAETLNKFHLKHFI